MTTEVKELVASIDQKHKEIEANIQKTGDEAKAGKEAAEKALTELKGLTERVLEAEQKLAERVKKGQEDFMTLGKSVVESAAVKAFVEGTQSRATVESKATLLGQTGGNYDRVIVNSARQPGIVTPGLQPLTILDAVPVLTANSTLIEFQKESFLTNGAAMRAEGEASGESEIGFELVSLPVRNIATHINMSREVLSDSEQLASYIDQRLTYALRFALEQQIVAGNGLGQNLSGMTNAGNFTPFEATAGETDLDGINRSIEQVFLGNYSADCVCLHPSTWYAISRQKTSYGEYVLGSPVGGLVYSTLWGLPVVISKSVPAGKVLTCNMKMAHNYFERKGVTTEVFTQHGENATRGIVTLQATARGALASIRPASCRYGDIKQA